MTEKKKIQKAFAMQGPLYKELQDGIHTRHTCTTCELRSARGDKCYMCLIKEFLSEVGEM